ncbi:MAG TPA: amino acid adenylation domain-containing protein, partial [Kofleriaceae bacterium]|nr:amino acid adenylation domain-containing protein [Kofleriaceae bacterium]
MPLSFAQQRLWFIEQLEPGSTAYNVSVMFRLRGRIDAARLREALRAVVRRHGALRTHFADVRGEARQIVDDDFVLEMAVTPIAEGALDAAARREAQGVFDLAAGPLIRTRLFALADDDFALVIVAHHSVCDQWSLSLLIGEAAAVYRGEPVPELAVQYTDYAVWQRGWLTGAPLDHVLAYWQRQLADVPAGLDLPSDRPRPATRSGRGARMYPRLPEALVRELAALGRREGVTLYMCLLAAFDALLWRYTGQRDVVVGSPIAGRNRRELEGLIGFFANTLVLRVDVDGELSFRELVRRVRTVCLEAYAHQDVPFEKLVDALKPARDLSRTPIFEVMFGLQTSFPRIALGDSTLAPAVLDAGTATFDLTVSWELLQDGGLAGWVEYNTDLFDGSTIERLLAHYRVLLEAIVARPDDRIAALPIVDGDERARVVYGWNRTQVALPAPAPANVVELFDAQARRTPDALAVIDGAARVTYGELDRRAERWAAVLRARGCGPGTRVALALARGVAFPTMVLAVLKAGAAYVPLDPAYPAERLAFMVRDCAARVVLTERGLAVPAGDAEVLLVDDEPPAIEVSERRTVAPDDLAYVIYTSGSTGTPKGVAMPHRAVVNLIAWQAARSPEPMRTLQFASPSFDVSFQELLSTWANGGTIVLAREGERRDPEALWRLIFDQRVERLFLPFVALHHLAEAAGDLAGCALREVITAGEQLRITPAIAAMFTQLAACRLYNQYGPTETHLATERPLTGAPATWDALPTIGRPIGNARIYVLDGERQPVPIGVPGELYIAGAGLARGYLGRDALTAERFVADPVVAGERMYRTGDRAKYLADGELVFLGRTDDQVKLRGYRIELGEIEAALSSHPDVREAAVIVRDGRLVGYVAGDASASALKDHLRARLPDYMVPAAIVTLAALPLSPNRKVDRKALPAPDDAAVAYVAPRTALEAQVAAVWCEVLGVARIGVTESFFEAGGHSLLATQVVSRLRAALGVELAVRALFEAPTIEGLAQRIAGARHAVRDEITPVDRASALPLSFAQHRLWYLAQLEAGERAGEAAAGGFTYNVPWFLRLTGALDVAALAAAVQRVVERHEVLRTRFVEVGGEPRQVIDGRGVTLAVEAVAEAALAARAIREAQQPFDLATGPLIRARLLRLADDDHALLLTMHHIVCDGWSMAIVLRELGAAYRGEPLAPLAVQYADFAAWQRARLTGPRLAEPLAYWQAQLAGAPPVLELPTDRPRPATRTVRGAAVSRVIDGALASAVRALAQQEAASEFMTLLAAYAVLLARCSGQADVVIGSPIAGRDRAELEPLIGFFVNTLALRVDTSAASFRALVGRVRETCLAAYAHQELPFERLVEAIAPERDPRTTPIFQVMFALQNVPPADLGVPGLAARPLDVHPGMAKFELTLFAHPTADGLTTTWEYNTDLFDRATIERMAAGFETVLGAVVAAPDAPLAHASLLGPDERAQLRAFGEAPTAFPADQPLHALFEAQVVRTPDALAVTFGAERLTYAALDQRANRLAHHLIALGVTRDDRVGVCLGRSVDFVVAVLATIKAGAAYVPLDPAYPAERLAYMTDDVRARVVITRDWLAAAARELEACSTASPPVVATSRDLAYVMYTSGSTGRPKGTCIEQRSIARLVLATDYVQLTPRDVVGHASNTSFDAATFEIWGALLTGARLHGIAPDVVLSPELFVREIVASGLTALFITTALFHQLAQVAPDAFRTLDHLLFGGEVCDVAAVRRVLAHGPRRLLHVYGPTEATTFATWHHVRTIEDGATSIPIGRPLANTTIRILDRARNPVPIGVRGEVFIGGPGVARGYWNRPELTGERFVEVAGERLYRTGDLAAWRADGAIDFHGRADHQVKLRGFRIELGEIEAELLAHPDVTAAIAIVRSDTGDPRLVAYVAPRAGATLDVAAVRGRLAAVLPRYMLPSAIVVLPTMPVTPNGKIDR